MAVLLIGICTAACGDDDAMAGDAGNGGAPSGRMDAASPPSRDAAMDGGARDGATDSAVRDGAAAPHDGFGVSFRGDELTISVPSGREIFDLNCPGNEALEKLNYAGWWTELVDDRPKGPHVGFYVGDRFTGAFHTWGAFLGCDAISCDPQTEFAFGPVMEFVQTGMRAPPDEADYGECARPALVPVIEPRPVYGRLRARFAHAADDACSTWEETTVEFDLPQDGGVCCPVGDVGAGTDVPAGGWAPDEASCWSWSVASGLTRVEDPHGCPALDRVNSGGVCDDYDGGVIID